MDQNNKPCKYCNKQHSTGEKQPFVSESEEKYCCEKCYEEHEQQADPEAKKSTECEFC